MRENKKVQIVLGDKEPKPTVRQVYDKLAVEFLNELSGWLRHCKEAGEYADVMSVAFWCRRGNIEKLREGLEDGLLHLGRGLLFHITPSNVPVNFVFSYFFGLLSGNANIVRLPSKDFPQVRILCQGIEEVLSHQEYRELRDTVQFVRYDRDKEINDYYSGICDGRIVWGGDETIGMLRQSPIPPKAVEVVFADRFSFGVIQSEAVVNASREELSRLAKNFYNDTYLMDQNACSTPQFIFWLGDQTEKGAEIFWEAVYQEALQYPLEDIKVVDKYTQLCRLAMEREDIKKIEQTAYGNLLYVVTLQDIPKDLEELRGSFGLFFQCPIHNLEQLSDVISPKSQTMLTFGVNSEKIDSFLREKGLRGIDRVVPFGKALDMGVIWDGYDIVRTLSRVVTHLL